MNIAKPPRSRPPHDTINPRSGIAHNRNIGLAIAMTAVAVVVVILLSPLLLRQLGRIGGVDWVRLSYIGQTYGAASATLSALAVGGVAISLFLQARQARATNIQMVRDYQRELIKMALENPNLYLPCLRPVGLSDIGVDDIRQNLYSNLRMSYAQMGYEVGTISEAALRRDFLEGIFQGAVGRECWSHSRERWYLDTRSRARRFWGIVDDEYEKAVASGPPIMGRSLENIAPAMTQRNGGHSHDTPSEIFLG